MERAKKMVLISKEQLDRIRNESGQPTTVNTGNSFATTTVAPTPSTQQTTQTIGNNLTRLDNEMRTILDSKTYANDHDRLKDYLRVLQRYLFFVEERRNTHPSKIITKTLLSIVCKMIRF